MSNFVVGDIQGCYKPLKKLLKKAGLHRSRHPLVRR